MTKYNLVLFQGKDGTPHLGDYLTIRHMMAGPAPDIDVYIVGANTPVPAETIPRIAQRPTLIFSPKVVEIPPAIRGARLVAQRSSKAEQAEWFFAAGIPHPETILIEPDTKIPDDWGPFTVVKPSISRLGAGVHLMRTRDVEWRRFSPGPVNDEQRGRDWLAQQFVNTGPQARSYRVFTVLGHPIYAILSEATEKLSLPDPLGTATVAVQQGERVIKLSYDEDVIALAKLVHKQFSQFPTLGIDILREHDTGQLFVLEMHPPGGTWHLSSSHGLGHQRRYELDYYGQFNALGTITRALIDTTRALAL